MCERCLRLKQEIDEEIAKDSSPFEGEKERRGMVKKKIKFGFTTENYAISPEEIAKYYIHRRQMGSEEFLYANSLSDLVELRDLLDKMIDEESRGKGEKGDGV